MKYIKLSVLSVAATAVLTGCYYDNFKELHPEGLVQKTCDTTNTITYQDDIKAIFDANCISCHNGTGSPSLMDYASVLASYSGQDIVKAISDPNAPNPMPPGSPLSATDIAKIRQWVDGCMPNGLPQNTACDTSAAMSYSNDIVPILSANCTNGCHDNNGYGHSLLSQPEVAYDTTGGMLLNSIINPNVSKRMPLARPALSACQIAKIRRWITEGALDN